MTTPITPGRWNVSTRATSLSTNSTPQSSDWSTWWPFYYDPTAPATPSTYTVNADGTITVDAPGAVGVTWSNVSSDLITPTNTTCSYNTATASGGLSQVSNGTVTLPAPPTTSSDVYVEAFDNAHNLSGKLDISLVTPAPAHAS